MKTNKIIIFILLLAMLSITTFLITYKLIPYSTRDTDKILNIYLEKTKQSKLDYFRLDINNDGTIDLYDGVLILKNIGE